MTVSNKRGNNREQKYYLYDSEGKEVELQNSDGEKDIGVLVDDQLNTKSASKTRKIPETTPK
jgi:hypothetical protein